MKFGPVPVDQAVGAVVTHSVRAGGHLFRKGSILTLADIEALLSAGITSVSVASLEIGDVAEDNAAAKIADRAAGTGVRVDPAFTGRANLFAQHSGVLTLDVDAIHRLNLRDEAVTLATLPQHRAVRAGEMVGTVKIIPYAVAGNIVSDACASLPEAGTILVAPFCVSRVGVVSTLGPGLKDSVIAKTLRHLDDRLMPAGARVISETRVAHDAEAIAGALRVMGASDVEIVVIFGASAITDRRDVIPQAIEAAGGTIVHLGMPVDPGNLLLLGSIGGKPVIGAPGCARSPKGNGFDWVLQRLLARLPVTRADIQRMGVGGLLMEMPNRPQPRMTAPPRSVAAIVLAAGSSRRMGAMNKLTETIGTDAMVRRAVLAALGSRAAPVLVVTGHDAPAIAAALEGLDVVFVHNAEFAAGLSTSLRVGVAALPRTVEGAVVLLGDMPLVTPTLVDRLIAAYSAAPEAMAVVPTVAGRRGNPVLIARALFAAVDKLSGDVGARPLIEAAGDRVVDIDCDDDAASRDIDTPEALAALRAEIS